jgi:hypothetical protein
MSSSSVCSIPPDPKMTLLKCSMATITVAAPESASKWYSSTGTTSSSPPSSCSTTGISGRPAAIFSVSRTGFANRSPSGCSSYAVTGCSPSTETPISSSVTNPSSDSTGTTGLIGVGAGSAGPDGVRVGVDPAAGPAGCVGVGVGAGTAGCTFAGTLAGSATFDTSPPPQVANSSRSATATNIVAAIRPAVLMLDYPFSLPGKRPSSKDSRLSVGQDRVAMGDRKCRGRLPVR